MKKRPKLSLSAGKDDDKKQALEFEVDTPDETEILPAEVERPRAKAFASTPKAREKAPVSTGPNRSPGKEETSQPRVNATATRPTVDTRQTHPPAVEEPSPSSRGRQIVKTLLVVAAVALSLYLLKRRFF